MKPPLTLAIETSNPSAATPPGAPRPGVALVSGDTALDTETVSFEPRTDDLLPAIDRLFQRARRHPRDLTHIAVSAGPGGFTAVRLAITAAKMIAEATGATCIPVPTALVVAHRVTHVGDFAVALASKNDSTYLTVFRATIMPHDRVLHVITPGHLITAPDLDKLNITLLIADDFLPAPIRAAAQHLNIPIHPPTFDPTACALAARTIPPTDPAHLLPIYPREPEAVSKWKQLHPPTSP